MALTPDRHTLLMVSAGIVNGRPPATAAWRAVIWPAPAWSTWPMITASILSAGMPARSRAAAMARPPRSVADSDAKPPESLPIGVRADETITEPGMAFLHPVARGRHSIPTRR